MTNSMNSVFSGNMGNGLSNPYYDWKVLVVDDEKDVHEVTRLAFENITYEGKSLKLLNAYSAQQAQQVLKDNDDVAIVLLDVVMETDHAGLDLVKYIRQELGNSTIRIVLRTGHPGCAPEKKVIKEYDINDYQMKTDLTADKLFTLVVSGLRSHKNHVILEQYSTRLETEIVRRKSAEFKERRAKEEWERTFNSMPEVIAIIDRNYQITKVNKMFAQQLGLLPEDLLGQHLLKTVLQVGDPKKERQIIELLSAGGDHTQEIYMERLSGDYMVTVSPLWDSQGMREGSVFVGRNISESKKAQQEQERLTAQLRQAQKMEAIGVLAGGIAHDFNNLLSPIIAHSEFLLEDLPVDSRLHTNAQEIMDASFRASLLVKQILTYTRQSHNKMEPIRIQSLLKEIMKLLRPAIPSTIQIIESIQEECGLIMADATQFHQVLMNLATNAYQSMEQNGGTLFIGLEQVQIQPGHELEGKQMSYGPYALLTIRDTGSGIRGSDLDKVFDPYFSTKEINQGTGLGLSVVLGIVKSCQGEIVIDSAWGRGTKVDVYWPITFAKQEVFQTQDSHVPPRGTERILLVDDEIDVIGVERSFLEKSGYRVVCETQSTKALEVFKANPMDFDLIITDMTMPRLTGIQLSHEAKKIRPDILVIICTGFSKQINEETYEDMNIQGFIKKPVLRRRMASTVRQVLDVYGNKPSNP